MQKQIVRMWGAVLLIFFGFVGLARSEPVSYRYVNVDGIRIFYREAGDPAKPTILLLHGFPSSSHMFRDLIPKLSSDFHLIAPDYPGMGFSEAPSAEKFSATFDSVAKVMEDFVTQVGEKKVIIYEQDFGGPVGMRLALHHPDWINGLIIQNTPISLDGWDPERLKAVRANLGPVTPEKRAAAESRVSAATAEFLYRSGARNPSALNPDAWASDELSISKPENRRIMTDLQLDIPSNLVQYPLWQSYLRQHKPKTLVVWGVRDPIFTTEGALAVRKEIPDAEIHFYNTGHFALEEASDDIAWQIIVNFGPSGTPSTPVTRRISDRSDR
jgi:pimeloyl-ACP methyl ester carboxylesterase